MFETLTQLHAALDLGLPNVPLARFRAKTAGLPRTTECLVIQRIGPGRIPRHPDGLLGGPAAF
jgi:hypothetical protein